MFGRQGLKSAVQKTQNPKNQSTINQKTAQINELSKNSQQQKDSPSGKDGGSNFNINSQHIEKQYQPISTTARNTRPSSILKIAPSSNNANSNSHNNPPKNVRIDEAFDLPVLDKITHSVSNISVSIPEVTNTKSQITSPFQSLAKQDKNMINYQTNRVTGTTDKAGFSTIDMRSKRLSTSHSQSILTNTQSALKGTSVQVYQKLHNNNNNVKTEEGKVVEVTEGANPVRNLKTPRTQAAAAQQTKQGQKLGTISPRINTAKSNTKSAVDVRQRISYGKQSALKQQQQSSSKQLQTLNTDTSFSNAVMESKSSSNNIIDINPTTNLLISSQYNSVNTGTDASIVQISSPYNFQELQQNLVVSHTVDTQQITFDRNATARDSMDNDAMLGSHANYQSTDVQSLNDDLFSPININAANKRRMRKDRIMPNTCYTSNSKKLQKASQEKDRQALHQTADCIENSTMFQQDIVEGYNQGAPLPYREIPTPHNLQKEIVLTSHFQTQCDSRQSVIINQSQDSFSQVTPRNQLSARKLIKKNHFGSLSKQQHFLSSSNSPLDSSLVSTNENHQIQLKAVVSKQININDLEDSRNVGQNVKNVRSANVQKASTKLTQNVQPKSKKVGGSKFNIEILRQIEDAAARVIQQAYRRHNVKYINTIKVGRNASTQTMETCRCKCQCQQQQSTSIQSNVASISQQTKKIGATQKTSTRSTFK